MINVLLDGWTLLYEAESSAALHLLTLLATQPADVHYTVALPGPPPVWLPQDTSISVRPAANSTWERLLWEQRWLPIIASRSSADLLHLTTPTPPLSTSLLVVLSPSGHSLNKPYSGLLARLRGALAAGGMSRLRAIFWPDDLPHPGDKLPVKRLPPVVYPGFDLAERTAEDLPEAMVLPDTFVLLPGPVESQDLGRLADVWSWVHGSVGEYFPLVLSGLSSGQREAAAEWISREGMEGSMQVLPPLDPLAAPALYNRSTAVFHVGDIPAWGNPARNALACAKPFIAETSPEMDAIVGPAAFLAPAGDTRALGAALITAVVEESVSEQLSLAARQRASAWDVRKFSAALGQAYNDILSKKMWGGIESR